MTTGSANVNEVTLNALRDFPAQLEAYFHAVPAQFRHWQPSSWDGIPSEPLTAIEQVCHVRDVEIDGYHVRFQRALYDDNPFLPALDAHLLATERRYASADPAAALGQLRAARLQTLELLNELQPSQLLRTAHFEGYGPVSVLSLVHYLCSHDQQHLAGLQWLLGKACAVQDPALVAG